MITVRYAPTFVRMYNHLEVKLKNEVKEKIDIFRNPKNHKVLKVHKLKGRLANTYSFSVSHKIRIVFDYENKNTVNLLFVGSHDEVY